MWSFEPIRYIDTGEIVHGYNKPMAVLMRYMGIYSLSVLIIIGLAFLVRKYCKIQHEHVREFFPAGPTKVNRDPTKTSNMQEA